MSHEPATNPHPAPAPPPLPEPSLQGASLDALDDASAFDALEKAFDFRGDVTLSLRDASTITGYIFDRRRGADLHTSAVRLLTPASNEKISIPYAHISRVHFGKDAAHGKSFETWMKKYIEKKLKGERASIDSAE